MYEALRASPQWNQTVMIVTYDEHGGYFDHVPTPVRGVPSPDGIVGPEPFLFGFDRLGVRVPAIVVSPWIDKGTGEFFFFLNSLSRFLFLFGLILIMVFENACGFWLV